LNAWHGRFLEESFGWERGEPVDFATGSTLGRPVHSNQVAWRIAARLMSDDAARHTPSHSKSQFHFRQNAPKINHAALQ
jgi:hypothetical protein